MKCCGGQRTPGRYTVRDSISGTRQGGMGVRSSRPGTRHGSEHHPNSPWDSASLPRPTPPTGGPSRVMTLRAPALVPYSVRPFVHPSVHPLSDPTQGVPCPPELSARRRSGIGVRWFRLRQGVVGLSLPRGCERETRTHHTLLFRRLSVVPLLSLPHLLYSPLVFRCQSVFLRPSTPICLSLSPLF